MYTKKILSEDDEGDLRGKLFRRLSEARQAVHRETLRLRGLIGMLETQAKRTRAGFPPSNPVTRDDITRVAADIERLERDEADLTRKYNEIVVSDADRGLPTPPPRPLSAFDSCRQCGYVIGRCRCPKD